MSSSTTPSERPPAANPSNSKRPGWFDPIPYLIGAAAAIIILAGLYFLLTAAGVDLQPQDDSRFSVDDRQIEDVWMEGRDVVDALDFFASGGVYESRRGDAAADIDQKYVLPLIKRLRDEHGLTVLVVKLEEPANTAMALIAEAPADREARNRVRAAILETADQFPGFAMQNWSRNWVSLDFLDELEVQAIPKQTLERLRESQRRME
jgi:hypothetical protein